MTTVQEAHVHLEPAAELEQTSHLFVIVQGDYWRFQDILQYVQVLRGSNMYKKYILHLIYEMNS